MNGKKEKVNSNDNWRKTGKAGKTEKWCVTGPSSNKNLSRLESFGAIIVPLDLTVYYTYRETIFKLMIITIDGLQIQLYQTNSCYLQTQRSKQTLLNEINSIEMSATFKLVFFLLESKIENQIVIQFETILASVCVTDLVASNVVKLSPKSWTILLTEVLFIYFYNKHN